MELMIGADPELFVKKGTRYISGHSFEFGTKMEPMEVDHGSVQVDGLALEFNVIPASRKPDFLRNVKGVLADLRALVAGKDAEAELVAIPTVHFGTDYISQLPLHVQLLGCNPDFNAYTGKKNEPPQGDLGFRTGAGHVHLGWTRGAYSDEHYERCLTVVRELDYYLGLPSLAWDPDAERRELYGRAGAFRPKTYGVEYRVLSNKWVTDDDLIGLVFTQAKKAWAGVLKNTLLFDQYGAFAEDCINTSLQDWSGRAPGLREKIL